MLTIISIIIPTLNEERYVGTCLESLKKQSYKGPFEIIVADGGSTDKTLEIARMYTNKVVVTKGPVGAGRNAGVKWATGNILAFIDADCIAPKNWLSEIDASFGKSSVASKKSNIVAVMGAIRPMDGSWVDGLVFILRERLQRTLTWLQAPYDANLNTAYRHEAFVGAGSFNPNVDYGEGVELAMRIRKQGRVVYNPRMYVYVSLRRVRKYGHIHMSIMALVNRVGLLLFGRTTSYEKVR